MAAGVRVSDTEEEMSLRGQAIEWGVNGEEAGEAGGAPHMPVADTPRQAPRKKAQPGRGRKSKPAPAQPAEPMKQTTDRRKQNMEKCISGKKIGRV